MSAKPLAPPQPKITRAALAIHILKVLNDLEKPAPLVRLRILVAMAGFDSPQSGAAIARVANFDDRESMSGYMKSAVRSGMIEIHPGAGRSTRRYLLTEEGRAFVRDLITPR